MDSKGFQAFVAQLGDLSAAQREALITALKRRLRVSGAIEPIDMHFSANPYCGHFASTDVRGWSSKSGLKRHPCKDCLKTFNALTGTPLVQLHCSEAWFVYAQAVTDCLTLRKAAKRCGISLDTTFRWRHRFLAAGRYEGLRAEAPRGPRAEDARNKGRVGSMQRRVCASSNRARPARQHQ